MLVWTWNGIIRTKQASNSLILAHFVKTKKKSKDWKKLVSHVNFYPMRTFLNSIFSSVVMLFHVNFLVLHLHWKCVCFFFFLSRLWDLNCAHFYHLIPCRITRFHFIFLFWVLWQLNSNQWYSYKYNYHLKNHWTQHFFWLFFYVYIYRMIHINYS